MIAFALTLIPGIFYHFFALSWLKIVSISAGTTCYHFAMRLAVGGWYQWKFSNEIDYTHPWFTQKPLEVKCYAHLRVKLWKKFLPTYDPTAFDLKSHSYEEIAMAMCQSELVHETIIVLSFLPLLAAKFFGAWLVFLITSLLAALVDLVFVILQRYNRPRILRLVTRKKKST